MGVSFGKCLFASLPWRRVIAPFILIVTAPAVSVAGTTLEELLELSFEDIINYEVVTPTKGGKSLLKTPSTVSVISYQDIQRSAETTIPELLRQLPGVNVRWNPMVQTIDIRGFGSNPFTSRVLLLIDGVPYNSWNKGGFPQHPGFDFF
jgi:outer membrane cobalamin receptor